MLILGLETSCDETAAAIVEDGRRILSNVIASQTRLHERYGGVVPEIACRAHTETILPVIEEALAGRRLSDLGGIAVTSSPGLIGALLIGVTAAKALAWTAGLPLTGVNHLEAHAFSTLLADPAPEFPYLALIASGGHTILYVVEGPLAFREVGGTINDAAGEAFDKVASILGLGYPGGPAIEHAAREGRPGRIEFPSAALKPGRDGRFDFSFSGLKTAVLYRVHDPKTGQPRPRAPGDIADIARAFQETAIESLVSHTVAAAIHHGLGRIALGGGVAANEHLRRRMEATGTRQGLEVTAPPRALCTDNAAMIAGVGFHRFAAGLADRLDLDAVPTK
ncbi:MAG: tRNA (adenosine(37)-N6)-threonylcarbamoyltransferase complex transferase subunit TsaD [Planctomycetota bacterium]